MCEFCEIYQDAKKRAKEFKEITGIKTKFKVKLCECSYKNRTQRGSLTYKAMKLVYCPLCGRKLSEVSK